MSNPKNRTTAPLDTGEVTALIVTVVCLVLVVLVIGGRYEWTR